MKYKIVYEYYLSDLTDAVQKEIAKGWLPLGGPSCDSRNERFFQAMTFAEKDGQNTKSVSHDPLDTYRSW